jgi:hypothetical protein
VSCSRCGGQQANARTDARRAARSARIASVTSNPAPSSHPAPMRGAVPISAAQVPRYMVQTRSHRLAPALPSCNLADRGSPCSPPPPQKKTQIIPGC